MMRFRYLWVIGCLWFASMSWAASAPPAHVTSLSADQQQWLAQHRELRVGLVLQVPYAQYDRRLQRLSGVNVELMQRLAKSLKVELSWRHFPDLAQLEAAAREGAIDIAPGLSQTPAGLRLWQFSDPYMRVPQLVVSDQKTTGTVELEKLDSQTRVAVRMPSATADYLRGNYPHLNLQGVPIERQALQLLTSQQASYAVVDEAQLGRLSVEPEFAALVVVGDIGLPQLLRVATRRDWPELAGIVESALRAIPAKDLEQLHSQWLQPKYPRLTESPGFWQNLSLLLTVLMLSSMAIVFWQRRQQHSLEQRLSAAREDIALRAASEEALRLTQFSIDQSTVGILWVNWDSHVRYANCAAETMLGYPPGGILDRPLIDIEPGLHMDLWLNLRKRARASEDGPQSYETHCVRADGSILPTDVSLSFLRFRDGEYLVVYLNDVTERRRALAALQESEARLQGIAANVPGLVFRLERAPVTGQIDFAYISEGSESLVGYSPATLLIATKACAAWCIRTTRPAITRLRTMRWTPTATGLGKGGFSLVRASNAGRRSRPLPAGSKTVPMSGTALSGTSARASASNWNWRAPGGNCVSCPLTWRVCGRRKRPTSPGKFMTSWVRC